MAGNQKEIYNVDSYTDAELYNVLDLNNPTDRELEAKILNMIWKYDNMQNDSGAKLSNFFKQIYDRFFNSEEEEDEKEEEEEKEKEEKTPEETVATHEGMANMNVATPNTQNTKAPAQSNANANANANSSLNALSNNFSSGDQANPNDRTFSYNIPIDYSKDNLNPLLKQTTKRIVVIDSQYRENKNSPSTNFTFNLSNPLKDVVSLKLYSFQIPYTWYTINNNYGSNFFYLKGNTNGIVNNGNDIKISVEAGNYTAQTLVTTVNNSLYALQSDSNFLDICFGTTNASYDNINSLSKLTFDIKKIYNEGDYEIYFPYWDSPQTPSPPITNATNIINTPKSIPGFLGFNFPYYSPNVVYGIYNQLSGYSTAGLAGAYSPINNVVPIYQYPTIDDTVNSFKLTDSNNYFDIGIVDRDKFVDPSNGTIYGGLRITLSNLALNTYYTRNELVNELNYQLSVNPFLENTYSQLNRVFVPLYLYYIDPYTFAQQNLTTPPYIPSPVYPYLYLTPKILNPFYTASNFTMPKDTPMYPLYTQPILQPDFTNPALLVPNPFYNPRLLYGPSTPIPQLFPFNKSIIANPFDPNGGSIPNPYDISQNKYIDNPYIPLFSAKTQSYLYYIDTITLQSQNLTVPPYSSSPTFPYLYIPKYIPNPFDPSSNLTSANAYYPLYTEPYVQIDPTNVETTTPNPFYNPQLINQPANVMSFPFNTSYIPNPFDPNLFMIPNPRDFSGNNYPNLPADVSSNYMINPYYALATTPTISYKYYIDSYTFLSYYNGGSGTLNTIGSYVYLPSYIYMYLPKYIYNPFYAENVTKMQSSTNYSYWPLYNMPLIQPDPTNPTSLLPNPFYNPQISNPSAPFSGTPSPFDTEYIPNPFDPNIGYIPNPYINNNQNNVLPLFDASGTIVPLGLMINPYYAFVSSTRIYYKYYIDSYTFSIQKINDKSLSNYAYTIVPTSPYLYVPQYIVNPFYTAGIESTDPNYCYIPLYKQNKIRPDPTQPQYELVNPFYNPQFIYGIAYPINAPPFPFNTTYIPNPFDPNGGYIPNPYYFSENPTMINPFYALISTPTINYKFYIDANTYAQKSLLGQPYIFIPTYPYLYSPPFILNPFKNTITSNYPYYPLFTQETIQPDPTQPNLILPNPFYNPKIQDPNASFSGPPFPFNTAYIPNPFDPNGVGIPNPFNASNNTSSIVMANGTVITVPTGYMVNPYYGLTSIQTISYKFYVDSYTYVQQNLFNSPYNFSPLYPYLYLPPIILNPFNTTNQAILASGSGPQIPYYSLFIQPTIQPDPIYHPNFVLSNPFYNAKIKTPSASNAPSYPFNTEYIPNPFDPNGTPIPSPYSFANIDISLNGTTVPAGYMLNPYYALLKTQTINYKYYLDPYTYGYFVAECRNPDPTFLITYGIDPTSILNYTPTPIYPYEYVPQNILNPFNTDNLQMGSGYPYWPLFTTPNIAPDPTNPSFTLPNPFYNPKLLYGPQYPISETAYPFNTPYIPNPFDPNGGLIPNPYDFSVNSTMINPYYALVTTPKINNNSDNPGYNPVVNTDDNLGIISASILSVQTIPNPAYNANVITATAGTISVPTNLNSVTVISNPGYNPSAITATAGTINVPTNISNVKIITNPGYNSKAIYDISNTLITNVGSVPNPGYNSSAIYDNSNNDATVFGSFTNIYKNYKANYSNSNQKLNQIVTIPNPYYNPNISNENSNPVNNWLGSSFSHYELRLKLNRLTMPIINSAYSKNPVPNVINQKITVKFPNDFNIWLGKNSAFMFNSQINPYPLSLTISESAIYETKVSFNSTPTIEYKCIKPYYDIPQNNYKAYVLPNIDTNGNNIPYIFSDYMNDINNSISTMNTNSINISNPSGIFRLGTKPSYLDGTSSNTLFYKNSISTLNVAADITKTFGNYDYYLDLGTGNLIQSLGLTDIRIVRGYDASNNNEPIGDIIYTDASKNTYENSQYYGGYGIEFNDNLWVAVGQGGGNAIVYSNDYGTTWNQGNTADGSMSASAIFTQRGNKVKYNGTLWVAAGKSGTSGNIYGNTLAYSSDGMNWTGLGNRIFYSEAKSINYNSIGNVWVAVGSGSNSGNTIAYTDPSKNFVDSWSGIANTPLDVNGTGIANHVAWDMSFNTWVAVGSDGISIGNTIVSSTNGITWTASPSNPFGKGGIGYHAACDGNIWVAVGSSPDANTCIAYAKPIYNNSGNVIDGSLNWVPVYTNDLFKYGNPTNVSYNGNIWITGGNGTNILATSYDGKTWTKEKDSTTNAYNTFTEGINHIQWNDTSQKWIMSGNCGFGGNSIATADTVTNSTTIPAIQPFPSGKSISTTYNIDLSIGLDNTLTLSGNFPINANGYKFLAGNFITLIPNPTSANKFSGRELINIIPSQAAAFSAPNTATLTELVNAEFNSYQDADGDYVLNNSFMSLNVVNNTVYATLKIAVKKYLTQYAYTMTLDDSADASFNTAPSVASWQDPTNTWWKYLKIPYWNYPLSLDASGNYFVNGNNNSGQLIINKSLSTITNVSYGTIRPNQLTIRKEAYTDLQGNYYPVNNKIIIQPQTVLPNPITAGNMSSGTPNSNIQRIPGWRGILPISGLTTDIVNDSTSVYNGYGYNTVIITVPDGEYSSDELTAYINNKLNASPFIPIANQLTDSLLTYNRKCITFGSGFNLLPIPGVGNICELLFNINMVYNTGDYSLDFFDPYGFSICNNVSKNIKSTSWDSTLGWVLGYRNYTEYPLSDTLNATNTVTSGTVSGTSLLQLIASNIANNVFNVTSSQLQNTVDPSLQPHIITLQGDTAVSVNIYNYFLITLDDYNQNHLNDGLVTTSQAETDIPLPSYANRTLLKCDPITQNLTVSNINTNSTVSDQSVTNTQRNLTQKQIYAAQEIVNTMQSNKAINAIATPGTVVKKSAKYYSTGPFSQDVFAIVPLKLAGQQNNTIYVDYSGTLQNQERVYFGPVNIHRMTVALVNDRGETVDLNGANWTFSLICEQLYQQKKT